ncbi:hypothetical protein [Moraxella sp. VT-16-12]|uniref:hypothetical protein n=1 Tax=Moraxella sp. VT-16-12 TaxID=2014877 RepID=UPI000B7E8310|nr:hypothetical protein [Moraxella sp. VT-16-12]TWV83993.1 hypothetical protein CEW93_002350 [Moraxella sp. VT-16-12]
MGVVQDYLTGLELAYDKHGGQALWQDFKSRIHGASADDIAKLTAKFPQVPASLVELLVFVGTT